MKSHYEILGVRDNASQREIRDAYLRLLSRYHPDHNPSEEAHRITVELNNSYSVLSNPDSRAHYDAQFNSSREPADGAVKDGNKRESARSEDFKPTYSYKCLDCQGETADLLFTKFYWVASYLVGTSHGYETGIWCDRCRAKRAARYTLGSALLGWWGIPWGPIFTLRALGVNALASFQMKQENANLLRSMGATFYGRSKVQECAFALKESLKRVLDTETSEFLEFVSRTHPIPPSERFPFRRWMVSLPSLGVVAFFAFVLWGISATSSQGSGNRSLAAPSGAVVTGLPDQSRPFTAPSNPIPVSDLAPEVPTDPGFRLPTGTSVQKRRKLSGNGELTVENGAGGDAVVYLKDLASGKRIRGFYVQSGETFTEHRIPVGTYEIYFATGSDWSSTLKKFNRGFAFSHFGQDLEYTQLENQETGRVRYTTYELTLHPVVNGNVRINDMSQEEFDKMMAESSDNSDGN